jgi:hypothetical protein
VHTGEQLLALHAWLAGARGATARAGLALLGVALIFALAGSLA